jgi:hypothetical protein
LKTSQESIVPNAASRGTPPSLMQPLDLRAGEVRVEHEAGALADERLVPASRSSSQRAAVRRSCQTIARWSGSPVAVPGDDRLALVRDADRRRGRRPSTRRVERLARDRARDLPDLAASCSTQPGRGKCC